MGWEGGLIGKYSVVVQLHLHVRQFKACVCLATCDRPLSTNPHLMQVYLPHSAPVSSPGKLLRKALVSVLQRTLAPSPKRRMTPSHELNILCLHLLGNKPY